jgi:5-methylcytosine-specific restriction endonuclease McrA
MEGKKRARLLREAQSPVMQLQSADKPKNVYRWLLTNEIQKIINRLPLSLRDEWRQKAQENRWRKSQLRYRLLELGLYPHPIKRKYRSGYCKHCGIWRKSLHRDHIIPKCKGGIEDPSNYQYLCANCHEDKTRQDLTGITHDNRRKLSDPFYVGANC